MIATHFLHLALASIIPPSPNSFQGEPQLKAYATIHKNKLIVTTIHFYQDRLENLDTEDSVNSLLKVILIQFLPP